MLELYDIDSNSVHVLIRSRLGLLAVSLHLCFEYGQRKAQHFSTL